MRPFTHYLARSAAVLALVALPSLVFVPGASAADGDCADLVKTYTSGSSKYARVKNHCGRRIYARAVVNNWPDSNCAYISAYATYDFRTGGVLSPDADAGRECG